MASPILAPAPSGADDQPALQDHIDSLGGDGGMVLLRRAPYLLGSPLFVRNKVTVRGLGRSATVLRAMDSFPADSFVVKLGGPDGFAFNSRLTHLAVDANNIAGSTAVYSDHGQEMTGLSYVLTTRFKQYGVQLGCGTDNYDVDNLECYPSPDGAVAGFYGQGNQGANNIRRVTVGVSGPLTAGVWLQGGSVAATSVHAENCADGVLFDGANGAIIGATGPTTQPNVGNLVRMTNTSRYVSVQAVTKNAAKAAVRDDFFGKTITDPYVQLAVLGDAYVGRLHVYGDKPAVTGSRGGNAAVASLLTQLARAGLIDDRTTR